MVKNCDSFIDENKGTYGKKLEKVFMIPLSQIKLTLFVMFFICVCNTNTEQQKSSPARNKNEETHMQLALQAGKAIEDDNLSQFKSIINRGLDINTVFEYPELFGTHDITLLHIAIFLNRIDFIKFLLLKGANPNLEPPQSITPVNYAYRSKHKDLMAALLEKTEYRRIRGYHDILTQIFEKDDLKIFEFLVKKGLDLYESGDEQPNCFENACSKGSMKILRYLLKNHKLPEITKGTWTPFHYATFSDSGVTIIKLLQKNGLEKRYFCYKNDENETAYDLAANRFEYWNAKAVKYERKEEIQKAGQRKKTMDYLKVLMKKNCTD